MIFGQVHEDFVFLLDTPMDDEWNCGIAIILRGTFTNALTKRLLQSVDRPMTLRKMAGWFGEFYHKSCLTLQEPHPDKDRLRDAIIAILYDAICNLINKNRHRMPEHTRSDDFLTVQQRDALNAKFDQEFSTFPDREKVDAILLTQVQEQFDLPV